MFSTTKNTCHTSHRLSKLDVRKSSGDGGVPTRLLRAVATEIAPSLCYLFQLSLSAREKGRGDGQAYIEKKTWITITADYL